MDALKEFLSAIGAIILAGGGLSLIVYQVFKHLATKWLDARFDQRLQALKHQQDREIEELRFKISALLDRTVKLHQREFEVLPEAWSRLNDAFWNVRSFVHPMQSYPDIDRMNPDQFESFVAGCRLEEWQKKELRTASDRNRVYQRQIFWHNLNDAKTKAREAHTYLLKFGIFIDDSIRSGFTTLDDMIWNALTEHQTNEEHEVRPRERKSIRKLVDEGKAQMKELERTVHQRLWPLDRPLALTPARGASGSV